MKLTSGHDGADTHADVEITRIQSQLTQDKWSFRDGRHYGLVLQVGRGTVSLPDKDIQFIAPCIIWIPADTEGLVTMQAGTRGLMLTATEIAIAQAIPTGPISAQIQTIVALPMVQSWPNFEDGNQLFRILENIETEINSGECSAIEAVRHHLALLCIDIWRLSQAQSPHAQSSPRMIALRFLQAVEQHVREQWSVARYAEELDTTPERLNSILRKATGRAPLALIHARLIHEADGLLETSDMPIAQVAELLGFSDPAYFSRFYKRMTGHSPNHQRREAGASRASASYAAWP